MTSVLPLNASEIEKAFDQLAMQRLAIDLSPVDVNPLTCPVQLLPWLAAQWRVEIVGLREAEQRKLIANALEIHRYKGTVHAVQTALNAVFDDAEVIEHQRPFEFDASVALQSDTTAVYDGATFQRARRLINSAKNARSRFGGFAVRLPDASLPLNQSTLAGVSVHMGSTLAMHSETQASIACGMHLSMSPHAALAMAGKTHVNLTGAMQWTL